MLYGAIRISPVFGGKLVSVSDAPVAQLRGVKKVIKRTTQSLYWPIASGAP